MEIKPYAKVNTFLFQENILDPCKETIIPPQWWGGEGGGGGGLLGFNSINHGFI